MLVILFSTARMSQARYFSVTVSYKFAPYINFPAIDGVDYLRGQLELSDSGYLHWQCAAYFSSKKRLAAVKSLFPGNPHVEVGRRQDKLFEYVWKDETSLGVRFEHGMSPISRNDARDWAAIRSAAATNDFDSIPDDIVVRYYNNLRRLMSDNLSPSDRGNISVSVLCGPPGCGKTRLAASMVDANDVYWKSPCNKWWDGYRGQKFVILDDFDGESIGYSHLKRWFDRYPCLVETKGGTVPLQAETFVVTTNVHSVEWYPRVPRIHVRAILRRLSFFLIEDDLPWVYNKL